MPSYMTPGVYIEEVESGPRPIEAVGTSTAAFLGVAPDREARLGEAVAIGNWTEFRRWFVPEGGESTALSNAVYGFLSNGGRRCFVVNLGEDGSIPGGLEVLDRVEEVRIVAAPGYTDAASYDALLGHCESRKDRVAALDCPPEADPLSRLTEVATVSAGSSGSRTSDDEEDAESSPPRSSRSSRSSSRSGAGGLRPRPSDRGYGACYFPYLRIVDPLAPGRVVACPPSGHMAGIWARTDASRGVHKAPANEIVRGALDLTYRLTDAEQGELNRAGVNCIRFFPRQGIRVWGARTVADSASEWKYLPVRRFFTMVEQSIAAGTLWVVFETNDLTLWNNIIRDVRAFLLTLWRDGAIRGATPDQAFFVQCDGETNPPESIDQGRVVTRIGIAPVKPAEFVVFEIGQTSEGTEIAQEGGSENA